MPRLADVAGSAADRLGLDRYGIVGHDIGGIAQHLAVHQRDRVNALALVNGVVLDSWPVPGVERFRDPRVRDETGVDDLLAARRASLGHAVERRLTDAEVDHYLLPWHDERRCRSWMAMAREIPGAKLLRLPGRHLPQEDHPGTVAEGGGSPFDDFLARYFGGNDPRGLMQRIDITRLMSEPTRALVAGAAQQTAEWGGADLDAVHLVWAMTQADPPRTLLSRAGADPDAIARQIEKVVPRGEPRQQPPSLTPAATRAA